MERRSVSSLLDDCLRHDDEAAFVYPRGYRTERWTYGQLARCAFQIARELQARSIRKGDRVLLWGENSCEWVAAFFACSLLGVIAVPMDHAAAPDFARRVASPVDARLVFCSRKPSVELTEVPSLVLDELCELIAHHPAEALAPVNVFPDDPLEIIFTSGTTAEPRGVVISHGNVLANLVPLEAEIRKYLKYERWVHPVRFLNLLPLSHVFGQFLGIFLPPLLAGTVIFQA